ncbi:MAG: NAD(P)H-dependent oxidoreductase subunit E [Actinomycetota bacterium]|nr:NAD(P)H-dependent oxidoreductase subunit E [Actinomycetota bacterium]
MDLHLSEASATEEERAAVDAVLGEPGTFWEGGTRDSELEGHVSYGGRGAREQRHLLLPVLHSVQDRVGWISEGALNYVSRRLTVPPAEAFGVASFYALFSTEPRPRTVLHVCDDIACRVNGAEELCRATEARADFESGVGVVRSPCLGMCEQAPAAMLQSTGETPRMVSLGEVTTDSLDPFLSGGASTAEVGCHGAAPQTTAPAGSDLRLIRRIGHVDPESLDEYRAHGGYKALRRALEVGPEGVIRELKDAKLMGRGGAAFPTGVKWDAVAKQPVRPHYFICNADESEPGTFKDRVIMEEDPFSVIEALTIAGYATGSEQGYLYIRGEYPLAHERLQSAVDHARVRGLLGDDVMGEGFRFDVEIRRGAGAYICGEETALFNSLEGKRGEPRNKPPFPVTSGLFGKPTGINNVETLINVLEILRIGGPAYAEIGTEGSTGPRLFCLSGCVERPGLYEVEHGTTLRDLLDLAGGVRGGRGLKAILLGGAAGSFVTPGDLDIKLTFEDTRAAGVTLGSGVVMVFDDTVDLVDILLRIAAFFRDESCGQCVPCRVGTVRQEEALQRLAKQANGASPDQELQLLGDVAQVMRDASICGLGQTAANAVASAIERLDVFGTASASMPGAGEVPTRTEEQES